MSLKIMVVDDEPKSAQLLRALATPLGHTVLPVADYAAAEEVGETQRFDVAFVGMGLPDPRGFELARRIRNSRLSHHAAIVMLSNTGDIPSLRKAFGVGADLVLTKPIVADHLRRMLDAMGLPEWKKRHAARLPFSAEVKCSWNGEERVLRALNISESGMLLRPSIDAEVGQQVALEFRIEEVRSSLNLISRVARHEGTDRVGVEFIDLAPEDRNAIQVYVTGRLKDSAPPRNSSNLGPARMFRH
jgi:CheY-like chemotaxis protein